MVFDVKNRYVVVEMVICCTEITGLIHLASCAQLAPDCKKKKLAEIFRRMFFMLVSRRTLAKL